MRILFCGTMVPASIEYQVRDISAAGNRFQNNMIDNLRKLGHEVAAISYTAVPLSEGLKEKLSDENNRKYVIRENGGLRETYRAVKECYVITKRLIKSVDCVMCYNPFYSFFFVPFTASRCFKRSYLILADYSEPESYQNIKGKIYSWLQGKLIQRFSTVVGLSVNTQKCIGKRQRFILMEGGIDENLYNRFVWREKKQGAPTVFMYSGLLAKVTGVDRLLKAFNEIDNSEIRLVITGKGELENLVKEAAKQDNRIFYKGHLDYEEYVQYLQDADVLINPRNMDLPENQNNFPSKVMDYLASGKLIISTKFAGWEKFTENIMFCDCSAESLTRGIEETLQREKNARDTFIRNRDKAKNFEWKNQLEKILHE